MTTQAAVWIDHTEARVFHIGGEEAGEGKVMTPQHHVHHKHPKGQEGVKAHVEDDKKFFHAIGEALTGRDEVLVVGPSTAKLELIRWVHAHDRALEAKIVGVETVDHPTDGQMMAYAKKYFDRRG